MTNNDSRCSGFTLIELSIVLVIISLIVGGVVGGRSLVHSARLQSALREYSAYRVGYNTFLAQYDAKPGDFKEGHAYFGGGVNTLCGANTGNNHESSCNGNGDGLFDWIPNNSGFGYTPREIHRAWLHMKLADILPQLTVHFDSEHTFSVPPNTQSTNPAGNVPGTKSSNVAGASWNFWSSPSFWTTAGFSDVFDQTGVWLRIGASDGDPLRYISEEGAFSPKDAKSLDLKADDGLPTTGKVVAHTGAQIPGGSPYLCGENSAGHFAPGGTPSPSNDYNVSNSTIPSCTIYFKVE